MEREEKVKKFKSFFCAKRPKVTQDLNEALYTASEMYIWPDEVDSVSEEQAILCWQIVNTLMAKKYPKELKM